MPNPKKTHPNIGNGIILVSNAQDIFEAFYINYSFSI